MQIRHHMFFSVNGHSVFDIAHALQYLFELLGILRSLFIFRIFLNDVNIVDNLVLH